MHYNNIGM